VPFNQQRFQAALDVMEQTGAMVYPQPHPVTLHAFETLPSTNQTAWALSDRGAPTGTAVLALQQTAGRGQWGRTWVSPPGGLYLSALLYPDLNVEQAAQLTLCTAWGIATALRQMPSQLSGVGVQLPVQLKWLNDLVLQGHKLGGILTETRLRRGRISRAVVGVGINWRNPVPNIGISLKAFLEDQPTPLMESLEMLAAIALHGLLTGYERWQREGIEPLLPDYLNLLAHRDRPVMINGQPGTLIGISPTGDLRVRWLTASGNLEGERSNPEIWLKPGTISLGYESCLELGVSN